MVAGGRSTRSCDTGNDAAHAFASVLERPVHPGEIVPDPATVRRLLAAQLPDWAGLPLRRVVSAGTVHVLYRLGKDMVVRLPRTPGGLGEAETERVWLPRLAPALPLEIPVQLAAAGPGEGYPWPWSVYRWLDGENAVTAHPEPRRAARDLGAFVARLRGIDADHGPEPGDRNNRRGAPLANRDAHTREQIAILTADRDPDLDEDRARAVWDAAVTAPSWQGPPVWLHGDLIPGNLLVVDGALTAVIDWGCLAVGDPAYDLIPAWSLFDAATRPTFRTAACLDDAAWARGRGWALSTAATALTYYRDTNAEFAGVSRRILRAVLAPD
jgi:aminoglycoside phosphotransferase (APT) family kinase protein